MSGLRPVHIVLLLGAAVVLLLLLNAPRQPYSSGPSRSVGPVHETQPSVAHSKEPVSPLQPSGAFGLQYDTCLPPSADRSWIRHLRKAEAQFTSQNGEDGVLVELFSRLGVYNGYFVEFGVEDGSQCNSRHLREKYGWKGLMMDGGNENLDINLRKERITPEGINGLFAKYGVPNRFDLLSIDVDYDDYWVWKALDSRYRPRVVMMEHNALFPPPDNRVVDPSDSARWTGSDYFGASLAALAALGRSKGYTVVYTERRGVNVFLVETRLLECAGVLSHIPALEFLWTAPSYLSTTLSGAWPPEKDARRRWVYDDLTLTLEPGAAAGRRPPSALLSLLQDATNRETHKLGLHILTVKAQPSFLLAAPAVQDVVADTIRQQGVWEPYLLELSRYLLAGKCLQEGGTRGLVLDLGSNTGQHGIFAALHGCRVIAVEMQQEIKELLELSIALNGLQDRMQVIHTALGEQPGTVSYTTRESNSGGTQARTDGKGEKTVGVRRVDSLVGATEEILFVKLDVEGWEMGVLQSAKPLIERGQIQNIVIELRKDQRDVYNFLINQGFENYGIIPHDDTDNVKWVPPQQRGPITNHNAFFDDLAKSPIHYRDVWFRFGGH